MFFRAGPIIQLVQEMLREKRNVLAPFPQRRHRQREFQQPEIQVLAQDTHRDGVLQIAIGCGNHAHVDRYLAVAADAGDVVGFDHPQQVHLQGQRHFGDFIEEQGAAAGLLEITGVQLRGAGERAALMPEQLAAHQVG